MASEKKKIVKSAFIVGAFTFLSRIFGLIRDTVTASLFGSTAATDALWVAFRIPNTLRRFVAEGNLTVSFVPVYTDVLMKQGREEAFRVGQITYTLLSILLLAMSLAGVIFSRYVIMFFAPGFLDDPAKFELTVLLNSIMFPYIFFAGTVALAMGILNSMGHFAAPAASPVLLNLAVIACSFGLYNHFDAPVTGFAVGVIIGGFAQLILQLRPLKRVGFRFRFNADWHHPAVRKIMGLMLVAAFGVGVYQINVLIGTILASFLESGSVTYLQYAIHFSEFPQGIFVLSVATAVLPELSKRISEGNFEGFKDNFTFALTLISIITIPATVGLVMISDELISLFFEWGRFSHASSLATSQALVCYSLGLWPIGAGRIAVQAFYSMQDMRRPVILAVYALIINIFASVMLMGPLKHSGLALATTIAAFFNFIAVMVALRHRIGRFGLKKMGSSIARILAASAAMGLAIYLAGPWEAGALRNLIISAGLWGKAGLAAYIAVTVTGGLGVFLLVAFALGLKEVSVVYDIIKRKIKK